MNFSYFLLKRTSIPPAFAIVIVVSLVWILLFNNFLPWSTSKWETEETRECPIAVTLNGGSLRVRVDCGDGLTRTYTSDHSALVRILYVRPDTLSCAVQRNSNSGEQRISCSTPT